MKTLSKFLADNPSYVKCSNERIAKRTGLKESTVARFKKGQMFAEMNSNYRNSRRLQIN
jgi:hypothetical protein